MLDHEIAQRSTQHLQRPCGAIYVVFISFPEK